MPPKPPERQSPKRKTLTRAQKLRLEQYREALFWLNGIAYSVSNQFFNDAVDPAAVLQKVKELALEYGRASGCPGQCFKKNEGCVPCFGMLPGEGDEGERAEPPEPKKPGRRPR